MHACPWKRCCTHTRAYTTLSISIDRSTRTRLAYACAERFAPSCISWTQLDRIAQHTSYVRATATVRTLPAPPHLAVVLQGPDPFLRFKQSKATERLVGHRKHTAKRMRSEYVCMMCLVWPTELTMEYVSTPPTPVRPGSARTQKLQPSHVVSTMPCIRAWRPRRTSTASEEEQPPAMCWHVATPSKHKKHSKSILY